MKKILLLILIMLFSFSLLSCDKNNDSKTENEEQTTNVENKTEQEKTLIRRYHKFSPVISTNCTMNILCRDFESIDFDIQWGKTEQSMLPHYDLDEFKFNPEIKFCFGLIDVIDQDRSDLSDDPNKLKFTQSISKATSQMMVLTFYFE